MNHCHQFSRSEAVMFFNCGLSAASIEQREATKPNVPPDVCNGQCSHAESHVPN